MLDRDSPLDRILNLTAVRRYVDEHQRGDDEPCKHSLARTCQGLAVGAPRINNVSVLNQNRDKMLYLRCEQT